MEYMGKEGQLNQLILLD